MKERKKHVFLSLVIVLFLTLNTNAKSSLPDSSRYSIIKEHSSQLYFSPTDKELETLFEQISAFVKASKRKSNRGKRLKMKDYLFQVIPEVDKKFVTPFSEAFQSVVWHCLVSHPQLQMNKTKW